VASLYVNGEQTAAVDAIGKIDPSRYEGNAKTLYENLSGAVSTAMFDQYYTAGTTAYVANDYVTAAEQLKAAVEADPDGTNTNYYNALYYLAFAYFNQNDTANANKYFNEIIEKYPAQASQVQAYIREETPQTEAVSQGEVSMDSDGTGGIVVIGQDSGDTSNTAPTYDPADVAWTDPYTGLHYDMYGNLLG
jgi:tetratricopeptide (TPR) repeat protein